LKRQNTDTDTDTIVDTGDYSRRTIVAELGDSRRFVLPNSATNCRRFRWL